MTAHHDLDRDLTAFMREGPTELPYESFDAVRDRMETTRQRVVIGPWRTPTMNRFVTFGIGAVAVVAVLLIGSQLMRSPSGGLGSEATPTSTPQPSPTATIEPTPPGASAPPLTQSFTSTQNGITVSYPEGWKARAATKPWTEKRYSLLFDPATPYIDYMYDPILGDHLFVNLASQPIGDATADEWMRGQMSSSEGCKASMPIVVDGATGLIGAEGCDVAVVAKAGRGYFISLLTSDDDPAAVAAYDRAWFEQFLATVQLHPEDAVH